MENQIPRNWAVRFFTIFAGQAVSSFSIPAIFIIEESHHKNTTKTETAKAVANPQ